MLMDVFLTNSSLMNNKIATGLAGHLLDVNGGYAFKISIPTEAATECDDPPSRAPSYPRSKSTLSPRILF